MNNLIENNIVYIEDLFIKVSMKVRKENDIKQSIHYVNEIAPIYRGVAIESLTMEIGLKEIPISSSTPELDHLYKLFSGTHSAFLDIGLGWCIGYLNRPIDSILQTMNSINPVLLEDGIGYFYGTYKGKFAIKERRIPSHLNLSSKSGFDQGLGRRLWYISRGNLNALSEWLSYFPNERKMNLWEGIGMAFCYVEGFTYENIIEIVSTCPYQENLIKGFIKTLNSKIESGSISTFSKLLSNTIFNREPTQLLYA